MTKYILILLLFLGGCGTKDHMLNAVKAFEEECAVPLRSELTVNCWNPNLKLYCDKNKESHND